MNLVGPQTLIQHLLIRGGRIVLAQLMHCFKLQFLRTRLRPDMKRRPILFESLSIIERALVTFLSQIPNTRYEHTSVQREVSSRIKSSRSSQCLVEHILERNPSWVEDISELYAYMEDWLNSSQQSCYGKMDAVLATKVLLTGDEKDRRI